MRVLAITLAAISGALMSGAAHAGEAQTCARGSDVRVIEVLTPGKVGKACDLKVVRDNGTFVATPYHANNSETFCAERAKDLIAGLAASGFQCAAGATTAAADTAPGSIPKTASLEPTTPAAVAQAAAPEMAPATVAPETVAEFKTAAASAAIDPVEIGAATKPAEITGAPVAPMEMAAADAAPVAPAPESAPMPTAPAAEVLAQPPPASAQIAAAPAEPQAQAAPQKFASAGPVALAPQSASAIVGVKATNTAAGRLVGAAADDQPLDIGAAPGAAEERIASKPAPVAAPQAAATTAAMTPAAPRAKSRPAEDVIRSVLAAQAAAWNEGDLDAFMTAYWKDAELRFVSDGAVFKGWKETMQRYRERYGAASEMGRLSLEGIDVEMVTDDVATVIGRYRVDGRQAPDAGGFTLVMKRFDGLWRIVQDHSVSDRPAHASTTE